MAPPSKRKREGSKDPEEFTTSSVCDLIRTKTGENLVGEFILGMMQNERLTFQDLKGFTEEPPSFSGAQWEKVATTFGLNPTVDKYQLAPFSVPIAYLPPSFHRRVMKDSTQWLDVYQERGSQMREAARVRLMDAWHVPVCALFKGRVVDKPENPMPGTPETTGGGVEHEVYMLQGIILIVLELKLHVMDEREHVAQVLLELASAYKLNGNKDFDPQPPVFAMLTDLMGFYFFSYDGSTFKMDKEIHVPSATRAEFFNGMGDVAERLFSIILEGYISILDAAVKRSTHHGAIGDVSKHNSAQSGKPTADRFKIPGAMRPSLDSWSKAAKLAHEAQVILVQCDRSSLEVWECIGQSGLDHLEASVSYLDKIGSLTDWDAEKIAREIETIVRGRCRPHG